MKKLLVLLLLATSPVLAQEYEILFTKQVNNNDNIYSINSEGRLKQITNHSRKDSSPRLSPNGQWLVFSSERVGWWKIWKMNLAKREFVQLTRSGSAEYAPDWSPDGERIVFVSGRKGGSEIFTMTQTGTEIKQLTTNKNNANPQWAQDERIYFSSKTADYYQIWCMEEDGSEKRQLTKSKGDKLMPQLSVDRKSILYYGNEDGNMEIYVMNISSGESNRLTHNPLKDIRARWSNDGKLIVFERGNKSDNQQIYIMNADGSNQKQLTKSGYNYAPSFAR